MRIGFRISVLAKPPAGIHRYVNHLLTALMKIDHENEYILYTNLPIPFKLDLPENFRISRISFPSSKFHLWYHIGLPRALKKDNVDLYHDTLFLLPFSLPTKGVITIYDLSGLVLPKHHKSKVTLTSKLIPSAVKRARRIIAISEFTKSEIIRLFPRSKRKIDVIYGAPSPDFHPYPEHEVEKIRNKYKLNFKYALFLGTVEPRKNLEMLLDAYSQVYNIIPHKLVIVGNLGWKFSSIFKKLDEMGIEENVIFTGFIPDTDLPQLFCGAEFFIYPSLYEGFGLPVVESMACGTPVVTSNSSSLPEVAGDAGILIDPNSSESLAKGIFDLANNPELRNKLSQLGIEQARKFTWEKSAKKTIEVYRKVMEEQ